MSESPIQFEIQTSSGVPIYRQLVEQINALVIGGRLQAGDMLPSVRQVALAASINPMTVSKAYSLLEAQGILERLRGQGMCVSASSSNGSLAERKGQFREILKPIARRARQLGLDDQQIQDVLNQLLREQT